MQVHPSGTTITIKLHTTTTDRYMFSRPITGAFLLVALAAAPAGAELYSYENEDGDYVITKKRPEKVDEYAVLTDDGEFIELVRAPVLDVPITHWRPWYLPPVPNPFEPIEPEAPAEPSVIIEEVDKPDDE